MGVTVTKDEAKRRVDGILLGLAEGLTYRQIALKLFLCETTVKSIIGRLMNETGCVNATSLVAYALRNKIIE